MIDLDKMQPLNDPDRIVQRIKIGILFILILRFNARLTRRLMARRRRAACWASLDCGIFKRIRIAKKLRREESKLNRNVFHKWELLSETINVSFKVSPTVNVVTP
jgi:hypothetical protein